MNSGAPSVQKSNTFSSAEYENILELFSVLQKEISTAQHLPEKTRSRLFEKLEEMILVTEILKNYTVGRLNYWCLYFFIQHSILSAFR